MTLEEYPFNWRVSSWNMVVFISFVRLTLHQVMNQTNFKTWKEEGNEKVIMCDLGLFCRWRSTNQMTEDIENGRPAASWQLHSSCISRPKRSIRQFTIVEAVLVQWLHNNLFGRRQLLCCMYPLTYELLLEGRDKKHQDVK